MRYAEKLRDDRWIIRRLEILGRDNYTCQRCDNTDEEYIMHVHHLRYISGHEPWEYEDDDLITLCQSCHEAVTHFKIPLEMIRNKWFGYEELKKHIPQDLSPREYESRILESSNMLYI